MPFQRFNPQLLSPDVLPTTLGPGRHDVSPESSLYRYCKLLCQSGGTCNNGASPVAGFRLAAVQAVLHGNDDYIAYTARQGKLSSLRQNGGSHFNFFMTRDFNAAQLQVLSALREQFQERPPNTGARAVNTFYCYHGTKAEHVDSICTYGMVATRSMDAGYFGSGCYSTLNIEYALRYAKGEFDAAPRAPPTDGRYPVIMFAASVSMAYPVTPDVDYSNGVHSPSDFFGRPLQRGFDCHVVCVNQSNGFQAVSRQECQYVEVVIDQESQMLPIAVLWFEDMN
jgi:hypothetical protein